jgi:hypothetical protein
MPRKPSQKSQKQTQSEVEQASTEVKAEVKPEVPTEVKAKKSRGKAKTQDIPVSQSTPQAPASQTIAEESPTDSSTRKRRTPHTRETVDTDFEHLVSQIQADASSLDAEIDVKAVSKLLKGYAKQISSIRVHAMKLIKPKRQIVRSSTNGGFKQPIVLSDELLRFCGWKASESHCRDDVTKFFCRYFAEHGLQNTECRKNINVEQDPKLKKILGYQTGDAPLTYARLQKYLTRHYPPSKKSLASQVSGVSLSSGVGASGTSQADTTVSQSVSQSVSEAPQEKSKRRHK